MKGIAWRVLAAAAMAACAGTHDTPSRPPSTVSFEGGVVLHVYVADDGEEQRRGLMEVRNLPENEGMAFVYDEPVTISFWMKDTLIPLSIAFVDESGRVIAIRDMEPCEADPCATYGVDEPYVLAVEANRGWFRRAGVDVGDRAELQVMAYQ